MDKYIGVKVIEAAPMSKYEFYEKRGLAVNDVDAPGYEVIYEDGYQSWSPKDVFEKAYKAMPFTKGHTLIEANIATGVWDYKMKFSGDSPIPKVARMTFGEAIDALKAGKCIQREGWNGKGLFVVKQIPCKLEGLIIEKIQSLPDSAKEILKTREGIPTLSYTNQLLIIHPDGRADSWVPSVSDMFAEDWCIVEV